MHNANQITEMMGVVVMTGFYIYDSRAPQRNELHLEPEIIFFYV